VRRFFKKSGYLSGFFRWDKYKPNPDAKRKVCIPVPPKLIALEKIGENVMPWQ
jgi:hypothetical protein